MECALLVFLRWQDAPSNGSPGSHGGGPGSAASLGVSTRLKDWIRGYPTMLPEPAARSSKHNRLQSHRETHTVRVVSVWRNVRMYAPDLAKTAGEPGCSTSQWGGSHPKCIHTISRLGVSGSTDAQAGAAIRRQFQEAHGPSPNLHSHTGVGTSSNASIASSNTVSTLGGSPTDYFG